jgi:hypothetical protein
MLTIEFWNREQAAEFAYHVRVEIGLNAIILWDDEETNFLLRPAGYCVLVEQLPDRFDCVVEAERSLIQEAKKFGGTALAVGRRTAGARVREAARTT